MRFASRACRGSVLAGTPILAQQTTSPERRPRATGRRATGRGHRVPGESVFHPPVRVLIYAGLRPRRGSTTTAFIRIGASC